VSNGVVVAAALHQFVQALRHRAARAAIGTREQRALYQTLLADLAGRGFHAALAGIALPNPGSIRLHEQVGFAPLGVYLSRSRLQGWPLARSRLVATPALKRLQSCGEQKEPRISIHFSNAAITSGTARQHSSGCRSSGCSTQANASTAGLPHTGLRRRRDPKSRSERPKP
jgi:hypothetical protein